MGKSAKGVREKASSDLKSEGAKDSRSIVVPKYPPVCIPPEESARVDNIYFVWKNTSQNLKIKAQLNQLNLDLIQTTENYDQNPRRQ